VKTYKNLLKYYFFRYLNSIYLLAPIIIWFVYEYILYSIKGKELLDISIGSIRMLFFIMVWFGFAFVENINNLEEEIFLLRLEKKSMYYRSRNLFIYIIGIILSSTAFIIPLIIGLVNSSFFSTNITFKDLMVIFVYHILAAILGGTLGLLFDSRYFLNRKAALSYLMLIVVFSIAKEGIVHQYSYLKNILYILPPIWDIINYYSMNKDFEISRTIISIVHALGYSLILLLLDKFFRKYKNR